MSESEWIFPLEVLERIAAACDGNYASQAKLCLVSRSLFTYTRPRLYRSFSSMLISPKRHELYLARVITEPSLADLVHDYCLVSPNDGWPRAVTTALLRMPNLKQLTLVNRQPREYSDFQDLWHHFFQSTQLPFQLDSLQLLWLGPDNSYLFESMSLSMFLRRQKSLKDIHLYYHIAHLEDDDLPNLRSATIDPKNWDYLLPGRPIQSLVLEGGMDAARSYVKEVVPGSPIAETLSNLRKLRIDAEIMTTYLLSRFLKSLEVLILMKFTENDFRESISRLPKIRVLCILGTRSKSQKRKDIANWLFSNVYTLTDVVFSAPCEDNGLPKDCCERYRRSEKTPEIMPYIYSYQQLATFTSD